MDHKKDLIDDIISEIEKIESLFKSYTSLIKKVKRKNPTFIELNALAMFLHSFYNGLENIFILIAKKLDEKMPSGERWHIELLEQMAKSINKRQQKVLTNNTYEDLKEYLGFRHFSRHAYSFEINWELMKDLIYRIEEIKNNIINELKLFIEKIE